VGRALPGPGGSRGLEGRFRSRVRHLRRISVEGQEFLTASDADLLDQVRLIKGTETLEGMLFAILFSYEEERQMGGEQ